MLNALDHTLIVQVHLVKFLPRDACFKTELVSSHPDLVLELLQYHYGTFLAISFTVDTTATMHRTHFFYNAINFPIS